MEHPEGIEISYSVKVKIPQSALLGAGIPGIQQLMGSVTGGGMAAPPALPPVQQSYQAPEPPPAQPSYQPALPYQEPQRFLPPASFATPTAYEPVDFPVPQQRTNAAFWMRRLAEGLSPRAVINGFGVGILLLFVAWLALNKTTIQSSFENQPKDPVAAEAEVEPAVAETEAGGAIAPNKAAGTAPENFNSETIFKPALAQ